MKAVKSNWKKFLVIGAIALFHANAFAGVPTTDQTNPYSYGQMPSATAGRNVNNMPVYQYIPNSNQTGSGLGTGASGTYSGQFVQRTLSNGAANKPTGAGDFLWLITGDTSGKNFTDLMKSGFHTNSQTSFGGRLLGMFLNLVYNRIGAPIANRLGALENRTSNAINNIGTAANRYASGSGAQYCYQCALQNSTNPYTRNPQAIYPNNILNGNQYANTTTRTTGTGSAGATR